MYRDMDSKIPQRVRSGWKAFSRIEDIFDASGARPYVPTLSNSSDLSALL